MHKAVFILAFKNFRDEEYFVPKEILENMAKPKDFEKIFGRPAPKGLRELEVKVASNKKGIAVGADGGEANVDFLVSEVNVVDFDAVVFIGGPGCLSNLDNENSYKLARDTVSQNKVLAAICISPVILAKAGVLAGKKATVWTSSFDKSAAKILEQNGAVYKDESVVIDGKIITANGPSAAGELGEAIVGVLTGK